MNKIETKNLNLYYGTFHALKGITMSVKANTVTALIGPSGCGKSTYLRLFNRMNDLIPGVKIEGDVLLDEKDIYNNKGMRIDELRKKLEWFSRNPILFQSRSLKMLHMDFV